MSVALILSVLITCLVFERIIEKEWRHIDGDRYRDWDARLHFPSISSVYDSLLWSDCFEIDSVCRPARPSLPRSLISKTPPKGGKTQLIVYLRLCFWTSLKLFVSLFYRYLNFLSACFFLFYFLFLLTSLCGSLLFFPSLFLFFFSPFSFYIFHRRDFILPLFIHEADTMEEISSMPNCFRHSAASMLAEVEEALR